MVYAFALRDFNKLQLPKKSVMELPLDAAWEWVNPDTPWWHHMPKQPVPNGAIIRYPVELLQHEGSPKVFKTVMIPEQKVLQVMIGRRCLFAFDVINGVFKQSPQQAGLVCPCCKQKQEQWGLDENIRKLRQNVDNQGFFTIELVPKLNGNKHQEQ